MLCFNCISDPNKSSAEGGASLIVKHNYMQRINKLREQLAIHRLDALLVVSPANCLYLSGFRGSKGYLLISEQRSFLLTDFRYLEQAGIQAPPHMEIVELENTSAKPRPH